MSQQIRVGISSCLLCLPGMKVRFDRRLKLSLISHGINHHLRRYPVQWMTEQIYLNPYPNELMLRNFV